MRAPTNLFVVLASIGSLVACGERRPPPPKAAAGQAKVLATVNGERITERDLAQRTRQAVTGGGAAHDLSENVLQALVRDELISQKALQLGLDQDEGYRQRMGELEAQLRAYRRQELTALYRKYVQEHATVPEADARAFFEKNAALIQTRFHVFQIFYKGKPGEIEKDEQALKSGAPFEEVAWRRFEGLPRVTPRPPWDLGELRWNQLPPSWRGVVDRLEPGQVSGIIKEGDRTWVLKLASKTVDPAITFETEKDRIVEALRQQKAMELYDALLSEMKERSKVVYSR